MKQSFILSLLLLSVTMSLFAQADSLFSTKLTGKTFVENRAHRGNQYYNTDWLTGDILLSTGEVVYNKKLKYNGLFDEVIWLNTMIPGVYSIDRSLISEFRLKNDDNQITRFVKINVKDSTLGHENDIFVEELVKGDISLYVQRKISITDVMMIEREHKLYPLNFIGPTPVYLIKLPANNYLRLSSLNKASFLRLFSLQKKSLRKLANQHSVDLRTEMGLVEMIELMNKVEFLKMAM